MLNFKKTILLIVFLMLNSVAFSHEIAPTSIAIYIQTQEYNHQILLKNYYQDYWYSQGPMLEIAAHDILTADFQGVVMCGSQPINGQIVLWLRPSMFYNPQMQIFYGKVIAVAYTANGKLLANYAGQATKHAFFDVKTDLTLSDVYHAAMKDVSTKIKADAKFQAALKGQSFASPCATMNLLPESKIQFMSFQ